MSLKCSLKLLRQQKYISAMKYSSVKSLSLIKTGSAPDTVLKTWNTFWVSRLRKKSTYTPQQSKIDVARKGKEIKKVYIQQNGILVSLTWNDETISNFHSVWLRHNCQCSQCVQTGSGQRIFDAVSISHKTTVESVDIAESELCIKWINEANHTGRIPIEYLRANNYSAANIKQRHSAVKITHLATKIPEIHYSDVVTDKKALFRWLYLINEFGLCLMKGVPSGDENIVGSIAERIGPVQETNYGRLFDVKSEPNPINIAYSTIGLDLHMDLIYLESPPGLQLLHCVRFDDSVVGGESTYLDVFHIVEEFRKSHPKYFQTLSKIPATFYKCHYSRENPFHLVYQKPHIILNNYLEVIAINWAPPFEGPLLVEEDDVLKYYEAYEELARVIQNCDELLIYKMKSGDLMTFNNHRILHGRQGFTLNGGCRHFKGCYVCIDDFKCKVQVLSNQVGDSKPPKHVGNQSWL